MSHIDSLSKINESRSFRKDIKYLYDALDKQDMISSPGDENDQINFEIPEAEVHEEVDKVMN